VEIEKLNLLPFIAQPVIFFSVTIVIGIHITAGFLFRPFMIDRRRVVKGFTDCPPVIELASLFGLDSESIFCMDSDPGSCLFEQSVVNFQDPVVPSDYSSVLSSGKCRQQVHGRLVETGKIEMVRVNEDGAELGPDTPPSRCVVQGNSESLESENGDNEELLHQQTNTVCLFACVAKSCRCKKE